MYQYNATVLKPIDGDTIKALVDLGCEVSVVKRLRFNGINTAESKGADREARGDAAAARVAALLPAGTRIRVHTHRASKKNDADAIEKYGRLLADVWLLDAKGEPVGTSIGLRLVDEGHAVAWDGKGARPT